MCALASAQHGGGNQLPKTLASIANQISANSACVIVSSRRREDVELEIEPELLERFTWIYASDSAFNRIFSIPENELSVPPEFVAESKA
jgi:hypothetical protein